jgi:hypothetical protein
MPEPTRTLYSGALYTVVYYSLTIYTFDDLKHPL